MYEVEIKVELTSQEKDRLLKTFKERGFESRGTTPQIDVYVEATKLSWGGYNIKRYRKEADSYIYTEKIWEEIEGKKARKEIERNISVEEFASEIAKFPKSTTIKKDREWFRGNYKGKDMSLTLDSVKFDHSPGMRYFLEAEIGVKEKENVKKTEELIYRFLKELLGKTEITDVPGMFAMAFEKK